jgi:hypothetical protein
MGDIGGDWAQVIESPRTAATQAAMHKLARAQSLFFLDRGMTMFSYLASPRRSSPFASGIPGNPPATTRARRRGESGALSSPLSVGAVGRMKRTVPIAQEIRERPIARVAGVARSDT